MSDLTWTNNRWHLRGDGIHAGTTMEVQWPDGTWQTVRIESADGGRKLFAHFDYHGLGLSVRVDPEAYNPLPLRWC